MTPAPKTENQERWAAIGPDSYQVFPAKDDANQFCAAEAEIITAEAEADFEGVPISQVIARREEQRNLRDELARKVQNGELSADQVSWDVSPIRNRDRGWTTVVPAAEPI